MSQALRPRAAHVEGLEPLDSERAAEFAHVLRRLTFGPFPGQVEDALDRHRSVDELIDALIDAPPIPFRPPISLDRPFSMKDEKVIGNDQLVRHWVARMTEDQAGLHERMMWFWHTVWTTSAEKGNFLMLWKTLAKYHEHAITDLGDLAKTLVVDPSMLQFLDGDGSNFGSPNENLGRELMELFMLGRGNYTEEDVRAAARSLSGRQINFDTGIAEFHPKDGPNKPDTFLGKTMLFDSDRVIDAILDHPAAAPWTTRKLWKMFIGGAPDEDAITTWANSFRSSGYELRPLLETMLHSPQFREARLSRYKTGIEWFAQAKRIIRLGAYEPWEMAQLGQVPFYPPNVAGWPDDNWATSSCMFARAGFVAGRGVVAPKLDQDRLPEAALRWCGIYEVSARTKGILAQVSESMGSTPSDARTQAVVRAALLSPEFAVA